MGMESINSRPIIIHVHGCAELKMAVWSPTKVIILGVVAFVFGLTIGTLSGYFGRKFAEPEEQKSEAPDVVVLKGVSSKIISDADPRISDLLLEEISADKIRQYLKDYASHPHLGGTAADLEQAEQMKQTWLEQGLDRVDIVGYDVLLSYPEEGDPNLISLIKGEKIIFQSEEEETVLRPEDHAPGDRVVPPFNAFSPPGDVTSSKLIYVNYGREEDFYWLQTNKSVNFTGSIVIARYGKSFRGDKVKQATLYGAKAVIFYSDPFDYSSPTDNSSYPNSWWLPSTGVQRGTVKLISGDPTTYLYPSIDSAYQDRPENSPYLPKIPAQPISYGDAKHLLERLSGEEVPESWRGSIPGVTYRFGGEFTESDLKVKAHITTHYERKKTYNVIGYIDGAVEPDRYVMAGNHRDAWVYGSVDPSSGTAVMLEFIRSIASVMKSSNWRPRRTLVFCSWGTEEYGLIGSTEFTEHFAKTLSQRAVVYINLDLALMGTDFVSYKATPMLIPTLLAASKKVANPNPVEVAAGRATIYDTSLHEGPGDKSFHPNMPKVSPMGSGSDFFGFVNILGISSMSATYIAKQDGWVGTGGIYPTYHSQYETFYLVDKFMDPGFKYSKSLAQLYIELIRVMSDSMILPLDPNSFSNFIKVESQKIFDKDGELMRANNLTTDIDFFMDAVEQLQKTAAEFVGRISKMNRNNPYAVREVNDRLMNLHRSFLDPQGLPGRQMYKNVLSAASQFNTYAGSVFPGITDSLHRIETNTDPEKWRKVKKNMSIATYIIQAAAATLRKSSEFTKQDKDTSSITNYS